MKRLVLIALSIFCTATICSAQSTFYFPQVANGILGPTVWKTSIFLTNPAASGTASGTISFMKSQSTNLSLAGTVFSELSLIDQDGAPVPGSGVVSFSIPAGATRKYTSTGTGAYAGGFAAVVATAGTVVGSAVFSNYDGSGRLIGEAGVAASPALTKQAVFVDTTGGLSIGVAWGNPNTAAANVQLTLLNAAAQTVATTTQVLGPGNQTAKFTSQLFEGVASPAVGRMQIVSDVALPAVALRFDSTGLFTSIPPVTIASLINPAVQWLERRPWLSPLTSVAKLLGALQFRIG
jgi:hypothetical protein